MTALTPIAPTVAGVLASALVNRWVWVTSTTVVMVLAVTLELDGHRAVELAHRGGHLG